MDGFCRKIICLKNRAYESGVGWEMPDESFNVLKLEFLDGIRDSLDALEGHFLAMEQSGSSRDHHKSVARIIHSLKGSGGSYEMPFISQVCHQLEDDAQRFQNNLATQAEKFVAEPYLKYVDLLRGVVEAYRHEIDGVSSISGTSLQETFEPQLSALRRKDILRVMLVDTSKTTYHLISSALKDLPVVTAWCTDGLTALGRVTQNSVDALIAARTVPTIDGAELIACVAALKLKNPPRTILLTSGGNVEPRLGVRPDHILMRNAELAANLLCLVRKMVEQPRSESFDKVTHSRR